MHAQKMPFETVAEPMPDFGLYHPEFEFPIVAECPGIISRIDLERNPRSQPHLKTCIEGRGSPIKRIVLTSSRGRAASGSAGGSWAAALPPDTTPKHSEIQNIYLFILSFFISQFTYGERPQPPWTLIPARIPAPRSKPTSWQSTGRNPTLQIHSHWPENSIVRSDSNWRRHDIRCDPDG